MPLYNPPASGEWRQPDLGVGLFEIHSLIPRVQPGAGGLPPTAGQLHLSAFEPPINLTTAGVLLSTNGTASSGITLARVGLYEVTPSPFSFTLLRSTANRTTWSINTIFNLSWQEGPITLDRTKVYAIGILATGTTLPGFNTCIATSAINFHFYRQAPRVVWSYIGSPAYTDLPANQTGGSINTNATIDRYYWAALV